MSGGEEGLEQPGRSLSGSALPVVFIVSAFRPLAGAQPLGSLSEVGFGKVAPAGESLPAPTPHCGWRT